MCICQSNLYLLNYLFSYLTISLHRLFIVRQKSFILFLIPGKLAFIWSFLFSSSICINYLVMPTHMPSNFILNIIYGVFKIMKVSVSHLVMSNSLWPHGLHPRQTPLSMGFSRQEYWSGLLFPPPGDLPNPVIQPRSPGLQADSLQSEPPGKPLMESKILFSCRDSLPFPFLGISDQIRSVAQSYPTLQPHESQHARPPCPSPAPGVHWDSCPSNQWCHPAISSSVVPFSSCPQSLPASESFPMKGKIRTLG